MREDPGEGGGDGTGRQQATLYYAQDNYSQCVGEWQQVLAVSPDDAVAHRRLGLCYAMRGEEGELEQALSLEFSYVDAYYFFLGRYYATEKEDYPRAIWAMEQFLRFSDDEEIKAEARVKVSEAE